MKIINDTRYIIEGRSNLRLLRLTVQVYWNRQVSYSSVNIQQARDSSKMSTKIKGIFFHFKMVRQISLRDKVYCSLIKAEVEQSLPCRPHFSPRSKQLNLHWKIRKCFKAYVVSALFKSYFVTNALLIY